jgi:NADH pyrophosphatase NudC (nudix superfamily)
MNEAFDETWREMSEALLAEIKAWNASHPKATFQELEEALHERLSRLEAQALQASAQARAASEWSHTPEWKHPKCPGCGTPLRARGKQERHLQGPGGHEVLLRRSYGTCPQCGMGLFPPR